MWTIRATKIGFRFFFVSVPFVAGILLPDVSLPRIGPCVNLPWDGVYGIAFYLYDLFDNIPLNRAAGFLGFIVWPILITLLVFKLSGIIWRTGNPRIIVGSTLLLLLSLLPTVTYSFYYHCVENVSIPQFSRLSFAAF